MPHNFTLSVVACLSGSQKLPSSSNNHSLEMTDLCSKSNGEDRSDALCHTTLH